MKNLVIHSFKRDYQVLIGHNLLNEFSSLVDKSKKYVIVHDDGIPSEYVSKIVSQCPSSCLSYSFPRGENSKSIFEMERLVSFLLEQNMAKDSVLIALGGGVTGDLVGFVASVYLRGIDYIQIPTTLLAQIDSSVGGKVAINTEKGKNVIGSVYPPLFVLIDPLTLRTLPERHFNNGMAEMIKYGMIADKALFQRLRDEEDLQKNIEYYIYRALEIKKQFVEKDEFDEGTRQSLNFGHTFGHAIESYYRYEKYLHGEAVAIGMVMILSDNSIRHQLVEVLKKYHLPTEDLVKVSELRDYINRDKKNRNQLIRIVDVLDIGTSVITTAKFEI